MVRQLGPGSFRLIYNARIAGLRIKRSARVLMLLSIEVRIDMSMLTAEAHMPSQDGRPPLAERSLLRKSRLGSSKMDWICPQYVKSNICGS